MAHGEAETSQIPRTVWVACHLGFFALAAWIYFGDGLAWAGRLVGADWVLGDVARRTVLVAFGALFWLRTTLMAFVLLKRRFDWVEAVSVIFAVLIYQVVFALLGAGETAPLGPLDAVGIGLFALGSALNTGSELQRKRFKADPRHQGQLYTGGLFRLARHINYFGDSCWVLGWAIVLRSPWAFAMAALVTAAFVFVFIPQLSKHMRAHYGPAYADWVQRSKAFVPFIY